jgi:hypothetical protein
MEAATGVPFVGTERRGGSFGRRLLWAGRQTVIEAPDSASAYRWRRQSSASPARPAELAWADRAGRRALRCEPRRRRPALSTHAQARAVPAGRAAAARATADHGPGASDPGRVVQSLAGRSAPAGQIASMHRGRNAVALLVWGGGFRACRGSTAGHRAAVAGPRAAQAAASDRLISELAAQLGGVATGATRPTP